MPIERTRHRVEPSEWARMVNSAYEMLVARASRRQFVTYAELCMLANLPREPAGPLVSDVLFDVSKRSVREHGCMLSSILIDTNGEPGADFYDRAQALGLLPKKANARRRLSFWSGQMQAAFDAFEADVAHPTGGAGR